MRETALYSRLRPKLQAWGAVSRVENAVESGTPDLYCTVDGQGSWVETKVDHGGELLYERFQLGWARRHLKARATNIFTVTGVDGSTSGLMRVYHAGDISEAPVTTRGKWVVVRTGDLSPVLEMSKPYDWGQLRLLLSRPFTSSS